MEIGWTDVGIGGYILVSCAHSNTSLYLSWIFSPRHLTLASGYHWSVLAICPGFSPPDTYPWPGDITGQFFLSVLNFLPQTPTPDLGISQVSYFYLSWIFSPKYLPLAWGYHWSVLSICPGFSPPRHLPLAWRYHWSVLYICPAFSPPDTYHWPWDITGQFFLSIMDFLSQIPTPGLEISLISSLYLSWIFSPPPRHLPPVWGYHWSVLSICPGFSPLDTYPWPGDITGQFFIAVLDFLPQTPTLYPWPGDITGQCYISVLDFLPQTPTPDLGISLVSAIYLS